VTLLDRQRRRDTLLSAAAASVPLGLFLAAAMAVVDGCTRL
jgi:hypothetical protein